MRRGGRQRSHWIGVTFWCRSRACASHTRFAATMTDAAPFLPGLSPVQRKSLTAQQDAGNLTTNGGMARQSGWERVLPHSTLFPMNFSRICVKRRDDAPRSPARAREAHFRHAEPSLPRAGAVKVGRHAGAAADADASRLRLDRSEHGRTIMAVGNARRSPRSIALR